MLAILVYECDGEEGVSTFAAQTPFYNVVNAPAFHGERGAVRGEAIVQLCDYVMARWGKDGADYRFSADEWYTHYDGYIEIHEVIAVDKYGGIYSMQGELIQLYSQWEDE